LTPSELVIQKDEKISEHQMAVGDRAMFLDKLQHQLEGLRGRMCAVEAAQVACQQGAVQAEPIMAQNTTASLTRDSALHVCQIQQGEQITVLRLRLEEQHEELVGLHMELNAAKELACLHARSPTHDDDHAKPTLALGSNSGLEALVQEVQREQEELARVQREQQQDIASLRATAQAAVAPHELTALQHEHQAMMHRMHELQGEVAYLRLEAPSAATATPALAPTTATGSLTQAAAAPALSKVSHDSTATLPSLARDLAAVQREQEATAGRMQSLADAASQAATAGIRRTEDRLSKELALGLQELARAVGVNTSLPTPTIQKHPVTAASSRPVEHLMPVCSRQSSLPEALSHGLSADPKDCVKFATAARRPGHGSPHGGPGQGAKSPTQQQSQNANKPSLAAAMLAKCTQLRHGTPGLPQDSRSIGAVSANPETAPVQKTLKELVPAGVASPRFNFTAALKTAALPTQQSASSSAPCSPLHNELLRDIQGNLDSLVSTLARSLEAGTGGPPSPARSAERT